MKRVFGSGVAAAMLALLVALAAAGWAHRTPALADHGTTADLSAFLATGGSVQDLCGTATEGASPRDHCPVCTLPGTLPPPVTGQTTQTVARAADPVAALPAPWPRAACHPAWNGRAPPVV